MLNHFARQADLWISAIYLVYSAVLYFCWHKNIKLCQEEMHFL